MTTFRDTYRRAFVLLSGGIDSATALYRARDEFVNVAAVSIDYGQRHSKEIEAARAVAMSAGVIAYATIELPDILAGPGVMLTDKSASIPNISYDEIKGISPTYVPFRNGTMLSVVAAYVMKYIEHARVLGGVDSNSQDLKDFCTIYFGAHAEDAKNWAYPDCTPEFIGAMANAIYIGTYQTVRLVAPFVYSSKADIITEGMIRGVPYKLTWSCYSGGDMHCGTCPTCRARKRAFHVAGVADPTMYVD